MQVPDSTYRIQFHKEFGFQAAKEIIQYLHDLGIRAIYASPIFKAAAGSTHGYDVADPNQINPEVGAQEDFEALFALIKQNQMGWIQDIVPNHMVFSSENALLMDVLEKGYASPYSSHFDISWNHPNEALKRKLLVPFLGSPYHEILKNGEMQFTYADGTFCISYYELKLPLRIESYPFLFSEFGKQDTHESDGPAAQTIQQLVEVFAAIATVKGEERAQQIETFKSTLWKAYSEQPKFKSYVEAHVQKLNADKEKMHELLSAQYFRLAYWRLANREINYRRFFNINALISVRVEDKDVFMHTHTLIFNLLKKQQFTGLRIDHIDGLNDPQTYLEHLREKAPEAYIVVEKILEQDEKLPASWPIQGTSGYDYLVALNNVFCQHGNKEQFQQVYSRFTGHNFDYEKLLYEKKKFILERLFLGDLEKLFLQFKKLSLYVPEGVDILQSDLRQTLAVLLSCFPVYRTYINSAEVAEQDREYIEEALHKAAAILPEQKNTLLFLRKILLLEFPQRLNNLRKANWIRTVMQFQQVTGPLMAKGLEDTTFYIYNRLTSLNEVGGNPGAFGITREEFHQFNKDQLKKWPLKINASATHDTKRGEDTRARINVLSEIPEEWSEMINKWHQVNSSIKGKSNEEIVPDKNDEYFIYQTLIGAWPFENPLPENFAERIEAYMMKAIKEAKVHTSWSFPNEAYEQEVVHFISKLLDPAHNFIQAFLPFQKKIAYYGIFNSISQTLLKLTSPGIPDIYQGCELWDFSLVDPDNRRPVDYALRKKYFNEITTASKENSKALLQQLLSAKETGKIKLFVVHKTLQLRNTYVNLFHEGDYVPLTVTGQKQEHVIAFARRKNEQTVIVIAPQFFTKLINEGETPTGEKVWRDTAVQLPAGLQNITWLNTFTETTIGPGQALQMQVICQEFPLGLLISK